MITNRLQLALERLQSSDWSRFERLASAFLATEFDDLRTVASPSGDQGRDAELFSPAGESNVVIQYSLSKDWQDKINATIRRLKETIPDALVLIYVSNQSIGADADGLKKAARTKQGLSLDVRDRQWFLDRVLGSPSREKAAEELSQIIVDPYLASVGVGPRVQSELSRPEAIAAVTFLGLQWKDDTREKGLTKLAFEALVRAALINTDSNNRLNRQDVHSRVLQILPDHPKQKVIELVDSALRRLAKHKIKHWTKVDEFCLAYEEVQRFNEFRVNSALSEADLVAAIQKIVANTLGTFQAVPAECEPELTKLLRAATDAILFDRSQAFAVAVQSGTLSSLADSDFTSAITAELSKSTLPKIRGIDWVAVLRSGVRSILTGADLAIQEYLRALSDSYTLLAFLQQTPDVQSAVEKMFSHGSLWLDTTIVLPLIADTLAKSEGEHGRFTKMIDAAIDAGLHLFVTPGVVEEVERHMNRAKTCVQLAHGQWRGSVPFLLKRYVESGRSPASFSQWLENFRGEARPLEDISEYLKDEFNIETRSLEAERNSAPEELRHALEQIWHERYQYRREKHGAELDDVAITRLIAHDVECYCGVTQLRMKERSSPFGYSAWWLTVDKQAYDLKEKLRSRMSIAVPDSPVMSADFMVNYLAFGPVRRKVIKAKEAQLPLLMIMGNASYLTPELMAEAENLRAQLKDLPERVIRRQVRDHLDRARSRIGPISKLGMDDEEVLQLDSLVG